jgi:hypothetical protein
MIEQQLAERFRAAVDDEPPLGFDPDEFVDRLFRRRRRRQALGSALGVVAVATAAVAGVTTFGNRDGDPAPPSYGVAAPPTVTSTPPPKVTEPSLTDENVNAVTPAAPRGKFTLFPVPGRTDVDRYLYHVTIRTKGRAEGLVQVRIDDVVNVEEELSPADTRELHFDAPIPVPAGANVAVAISCGKSAADDGLCRAGVSFQFGVVDR